MLLRRLIGLRCGALRLCVAHVERSTAKACATPPRGALRCGYIGSGGQRSADSFALAIRDGEKI